MGLGRQSRLIPNTYVATLRKVGWAVPEALGEALKIQVRAMYRKIIKIDSREMMKRVGMFRFVSVAFGNSRRTECLPIMRSRDSDTKSMSESSKRPPEPGDAACQNHSYFIKSYTCTQNRVLVLTVCYFCLLFSGRVPGIVDCSLV